MQPSKLRPRKVARRVRDERWRVAAVRLRVERAYLARRGKPRQAPQGRLLCYHSTGTPEWGVNDVPPARFLEQVDLALQLGYRFMPSATIASGQGGAKDLALTFDDGLRSILGVVPGLQTRGVAFSVFVVVDWATNPADRFLSWDELAALAAAGATIGSHSVTHANFRGLSEGERRRELVDSREAIERRLGIAPEQFAIPFGRSRDWDGECTRLAREAGYTAVLAQSEERRPAGTLPRSFVTKYDGPREFQAMLEGRFDAWEEWF